MPRTYGKTKVEVWESGSDFRLLSLEAQWAYLMLVSQESVSMAGTLPYAPRKWAKLAAGLTVERLEEIVGELEAEWYVIVDRESEELLIRSFVKHEAPWRTPNFLTAARSKFRSTESELIRDYLAKRHPWLVDLTVEKDEIEALESQASARPSERTSPLPFERASVQASSRTSPQGDSRARVASASPETATEECRVEGEGDTPRANADSPPSAAHEAAPSAHGQGPSKERLAVQALCPECGPLHDTGPGFDMVDHLRNVHDKEPVEIIELLGAGMTGERLDQVLLVLVPGEDEGSQERRIELADLAADLRAESAA
jgi:hypothetical protein